MRLLTIMLRFGTEAYPQAEAQMATLFARHLQGVDHDLLIVDNAEPPGFNEATGRRTIIGGDNRCREFTGFDRAVAYMGRRLRQYDLVHFVTDAFHTLYVDYLDRFDTALLTAIAGKPVCVGHIDCYNEPIEILGVASQHWVRSCYFFMTPDDVRALGSFVGIPDPQRFFSGNPAAPFRADAPLSRRYQDYLIDWITGQNIGQAVQWHSSFELTEAALASFEQKSQAIMNEHVLGIRLRALGCRLIDVTWLSASLGRRPISAIDLNLNWRQQLAQRDHAAMVVAG
jgi:hypothetical protein